MANLSQQDDKSSTPPATLHTNRLWSSSKPIIFAPASPQTTIDKQWGLPMSLASRDRQPVAEQQGRHFSTSTGGLATPSKLRPGTYKERPVVAKKKILAPQDFEEIEAHRERIERERPRLEREHAEKAKREAAAKQKAEEEAAYLERQRVQMEARQKEEQRRSMKREQERLARLRSEKVKHRFDVDLRALTRDVKTIQSRLAQVTHVHSSLDFERHAFTAVVDGIECEVVAKLQELEAFQKAVLEAKPSSIKDGASIISDTLNSVGNNLIEINRAWEVEHRTPSLARLAFMEVQRQEMELQDHLQMMDLEKPVYEVAELNATLLADEGEGLPVDYRKLQRKVRDVYEALTIVSNALRDIRRGLGPLTQSAHASVATTARAQISFYAWHEKATDRACTNITQLGHLYRRIFRWSRGIHITEFDLMRFKLESPFRLVLFQMLQILDDVDTLTNPSPPSPHRILLEDRMTPQFRRSIEPLRTLRLDWRRNIRAFLDEVDILVPTTHVQYAMKAKLLQSPLWVQEHFRLMVPILETYARMVQVISLLESLLRSLRLRRDRGGEELEKELRAHFTVLADLAGGNRSGSSSGSIRDMILEADAIMGNIARRKYDMGALDPEHLQHSVRRYRQWKILPRTPATTPSLNKSIDLSPSSGSHLAVAQQQHISPSSTLNEWVTPDLSAGFTGFDISHTELTAEEPKVMEEAEKEQTSVWPRSFEDLPESLAKEIDATNAFPLRRGKRTRARSDEVSARVPTFSWSPLRSHADKLNEQEDLTPKDEEGSNAQFGVRRASSRASSRRRRVSERKSATALRASPNELTDQGLRGDIQKEELSNKGSVGVEKNISKRRRSLDGRRTAAPRSRLTSSRARKHKNAIDNEQSHDISATNSPEDLGNALDPRASITGLALSPTHPKQAPVPGISLAPSSIEHTEIEVESMDDTEPAYVPLTYQIPEDELRKSMLTSKTSSVAWWSYDKYRGPQGKKITMHYCKSKQTSETIAQKFLGQPILGCDIEWKSQQPVKADNIKHNVSIIQIACEDRIALFHLALHKGDTVDDILPPTLKLILESPEVLKCGVAISGDFTRMNKHLGIQPAGLMELSHLHKLVLYGATNPSLVNKKPVGLAAQVLQHLCLPLRKGDVRTSDWSRELNYEQCIYAADDAYASFRVFHALEEKRRALKPMPPMPAFAELKLPIQLAQAEGNESESEEDSDFASGAEESLDEQLGSLMLDEGNSDAESTDSFGENVFDSLTEEELEQLQARAVPAEVEDFTQEPPLILLEPDDTSTSRVRYPLLPPLHDVGWDSRAAPCVSDPESVAKESNGAIDVAQSKEADKLRNDLAVEATAWALQKASSKPEVPSPKSTKSNVSPASLRAYYLWEMRNMDTDEIGKVLGLKKSTVSTYIAQCLQFGDVAWSDKKKLKLLVQELPYSTKGYYWRIIKEANEA